MSAYQGLVLFNYRLTRLLGEGGFGVVYEAVHEQLGRRAAVKILRPEFARHPEVVGRFFNEAQAACAIGHPAIIDITNTGRLDSGEPFIMMDFVAGMSLAELVATTGPIALASVTAIFGPVASALTAAHGKGVIHRDLKPDNVMVVSTDGEVTAIKLLDFGIAKLTDAPNQDVSTRAGSTMGTPAFMAPEQAADAKRVDARADVYGFGATLLAALTGRPPFEAESLTALLLQVVGEPAPRLRSRRPDLPVALDTAVARCLEKNASRRPATIAEAWREISAAVGLAPPDVLPARPRRRGIVAAVLAATTFAALIVVAIVTRTGDESRPAPVAIRDAATPAVDPDVACRALEPKTANPFLGALPRPTPALSARSVDGSVIDLGRLRGHVVLMNFGASWSRPAENELPALTALGATIGPALVIVRVASEDTPDAVRPSPTYRTIVDSPACGALGAITTSWGVRLVPESYLIDRSGNVRFYFDNSRDWSQPDAIACVRALAGEARPTAAAASPVAIGTGTATPCPLPARSDPAPEVRGAVRGTVSLGPRLKNAAAVRGAVFIAARRADDHGAATGAPLAVAKVDFTGKPIEFELSPARPMVADDALSGQLIIEAHYDQDGDALTRQPGDLLGLVEVTAPATDVTLRLDTVVK